MIIPADAEKSEASSSTSTAGTAGRGYRLKRGTKVSDLPPVPPSPAIPLLSDLNGPFQLAEYLALLVRHDPHDIDALIEIPGGDGSGSGSGSAGGSKAEKDVWIYEHLRRIPIDLTPLLTSLLSSCTRKTCRQMKADEWLYLCVAHGGRAEECCAIDYIIHTLDSTTTLLNSSKSFPSRLSIPPSSLTHFPSLFRRLSRIFSHAYFHHREAFSLAEAENSLYARFVALCERYELVGPSLLVIPREAVGQFVKKRNGARDEDNHGAAGAANGFAEDEDEFNRGPVVGIGSRSPEKPRSPQKSRSPQSTFETVRDSPRNSTAGGGGMTIGRGTLGRGKQPRATMLWAAAADAPSVPEVPEVPGVPVESASKKDEVDEAEVQPSGVRSRSESIQSVIHVPRESAEQPERPSQAEAGAGARTELEPQTTSPTTTTDDEAAADLAAEVEEIPTPMDTEAEEVENGPAAPAPSDGTTEEGVGAQGGNGDEEEEVPKDEIELLEEEGLLKPEPAVAPLSPLKNQQSGQVVQQDGEYGEDETAQVEEAAAEVPLEEGEGDGMEEVQLDEESGREKTVAGEKDPVEGENKVDPEPDADADAEVGLETVSSATTGSKGKKKKKGKGGGKAQQAGAIEAEAAAKVGVEGEGEGEEIKAQ